MKGLQKLGTIVLAGILSTSVFSLVGCNDEPEAENPEHVHEWVITSTKAATCGEAEILTYSCSCGETRTERGAAATGNHSYGDDNICDDCGYIDFSGIALQAAIERYGYYVVDADGSNTYTTGDTVYFGSYPQELVKEESLLVALSAEEGILPTAENAEDWTSYGYYDAGETADYMFYKDVTLGDGARYRGVYLLKYRPYFSGFAADAANSYIDDEDYALNEVYWFAYAPIGWTALDYSDGNLLLNATYCIESQPFQALYEGDSSNVTIPGTNGTPVNDWEASTIRSYLNSTFIDFAFTESEAALIQTATLDNQTTGYTADATYQTRQNDTTDRVFLLSFADMINTDYGFTAQASYEDEVQNGEAGKAGNYDAIADALIRRRSFTDYSVIQGLHTSSVAHTATGDPACWYLLRSAGSSVFGVAGVNKYGSVIYSRPVNLTGVLDGTDPTSEDCLAINGNYGVLPSLYLKVGK